MKSKVVLFLLLLSIMSNAYSKGLEGYYTLSVKMLAGSSEKPIGNTFFVINGDTVISDDNGILTYKVLWRTVCDFRVNIFNKRNANKKINPDYIIVRKNNLEKRIKNRWRKYGLRQHNEEFPKICNVVVYW